MDKKQNRYQMTFELVHVIIELSLSQAIFYDKCDEQTKDLQLFEQFVDSVEKNVYFKGIFLNITNSSIFHQAN